MYGPFPSLPLVCPNCGADRRIVAFITEAAPVERILTHIGEPPRPPPVAPARGPPAWDDPPVDLVPDWGVMAQPSPVNGSRRLVAQQTRHSLHPLRSRPHQTPPVALPDSGLLPAPSRRLALRPRREPSFDATFPRHQPPVPSDFLSLRHYNARYGGR